MKCSKCEAPTVVRSKQRYHYAECGLDNVYLYNIDLLVCEKCKRVEPVIPRTKLLHSTIARAIALQPYPLRGQDIRFLRKQHRFKAQEWASLLRIDASTLSRWENDGQQIGPQADALIRYLFLRLLEQEGENVQGPLAEQIAAATQERPGEASVLIDAGHPAIYSYQCGNLAALV
jgi:DNA-binding transcriptional regulator YiaG